MNEYKYTDEWSGRSTAIEEALYDANTGTLAVELSSGNVYAYKVPERVWNDFKAAWSKGRFYAKTIKKEYGPGEFLGFDALGDFEERDNSVPAPDMGPVVVPEAARAAVGAPQAWSLKEPVAAAVTQRFDLVTNLQPALLEDRLPHTLKFTVGDGTSVKQYRLDAKDVSEAVAVLNGIGDAVGLDFKVKEVVVSFE